ncbi:MAG: RIP metalloprotease RseP [Candidatus Rokubacteria bacterium]|nr:RIP metalloprotease RseP [Candidatus Rokubacteria bacterium]
MTTLVSFVVVVGLLILIHELGHFVMARWAGVGVERFSIGFGPVLLRWRSKETEYCLSVIPMGGYVKMMGEENPLEGGGSATVDPAKSFSLKPLWARALIVFAGPGMNFVLAAAILASVFVVQGRPVLPPVLGRIQPGGPAAEAGLRTGDRVVAAEGRPVTNWEDLFRVVLAARGETIQIVVLRGGEERKVALIPVRTKVRDIFGDERESWDLGARPFTPAKIGEVLAGYPAAQAGLQGGDSVVALDGAPIASWDELAEEIRKRPGRPVHLTLERAGQRLTLAVTPQPTKERGPGGEEIEVGRIGISPLPMVTFVRSNPIVAVGDGLARTAEMTWLTAIGLWKLVTGQLPVSTIGGPIQIAVTAGEQARQGITSLAFFTAVISVNLALLNLLPVPVLDGGHLLFFAIEAVLGRPLSLRKRELAQQVGFFLLLLLMVFAVYNDLVKNADHFFRFLR